MKHISILFQALENNPSPRFLLNCIFYEMKKKKKKKKEKCKSKK